MDFGSHFGPILAQFWFQKSIQKSRSKKGRKSSMQLTRLLRHGGRLGPLKPSLQGSRGQVKPYEHSTCAKARWRIQYNTTQNDTIQHTDIVLNTIRNDRNDTGLCITIGHNTTYYTIQHDAIQYNTIQYSTIQYNAILHDTIQPYTLALTYYTIRYDTLQCNTTH